MESIRKFRNVAALLDKSLPDIHRKQLILIFLAEVRQTKTLCEDLGLSVSSLRASQLLDAAGRLSSLSAEGCEQAAETMQADLSIIIENEASLRKFLTLLPEQAKYYDHPFDGWEEIINSFPDATEDIEEMNICFALERYPATVFHSLLVAECGIVKFGRVIGVNDPKEGWDATCKKMDAILKAGHSAAAPPGIQFEFIEQVNVLIQAMKHAWRNKVNHSAGKLVVMKSGFGEPIAEEIVKATRSLMRTLAQGLPPISECYPSSPAPDAFALV